MSTRVTLRISETLKNRIEAIAKEAGKSPSDVMRTVLEKEFNPDGYLANWLQFIKDAEAAQAANAKVRDSGSTIIESLSMK